MKRKSLCYSCLNLYNNDDILECECDHNQSSHDSFLQESPLWHCDMYENAELNEIDPIFII